MDSEKALTQVVSSLQQGAELRIKVAQDCGRTIVEAVSVIIESLRSGGKLLFFGNGGSAADAQHLAAEFVGRFVMERPGLPAMALKKYANHRYSWSKVAQNDDSLFDLLKCCCRLDRSYWLMLQIERSHCGFEHCYANTQRMDQKISNSRNSTNAAIARTLL